MTSDQGNRAEQMRMLELVWRGWCQDTGCPENPFFGAKLGETVRIKPPECEWCDRGSRDGKRCPDFETARLCANFTR